MSKTKIQYSVGTRGSRLALIQTQQVIDLLHRLAPRSQFKIRIISTRGEHDSRSPLPQIGGKGLFTDELEQQLLDGKIDFAVHSAKDLPTGIHSGLAVAAYTKRLDPRDALLTAGREPLSKLPKGTIIGTSSPRRQALLRRIRPDLNFTNIRGNIDTRIRKVRHGQCQATVLAHAGLLRAGLDHEADQLFELDQFPPAPGQGALALECRHDDMRVFQLLEKINHQPTSWAVMAERTILQELNAGCALPLAIYASYGPETKAEKSPPDQISLHALVMDPNYLKDTIECTTSGPASQWRQLAGRLAKELISRGAGKLIDRLTGRD